MEKLVLRRIINFHCINDCFINVPVCTTRYDRFLVFLCTSINALFIPTVTFLPTILYINDYFDNCICSVNDYIFQLCLIKHKKFSIFRVLQPDPDPVGHLRPDADIWDRIQIRIRSFFFIPVSFFFYSMLLFQPIYL
jgi:hypothetical protein